MSNKSVLALFLVATVGVTAGSAWAASEASSNVAGDHAAVTKDFSKLSVDAEKGYRDLTVARLAIYDGKTDQAKKYVDEADAAFAKAKGDDSVFIKAETDLMTVDQMKAKQANTGKTDAKTADTKTADTKTNAAGSTGDATAKVAWLPVDGAMSLDEDYTLSPAKAKAVGEANKSIAKGDRQGALDKLKLADVSTSIVLEVVPRDQTVTDVHQAAQLIDSGKFYEGSQMLRKVQMAARYDVTELVGTPKSAANAQQPATTTQK